MAGARHAVVSAGARAVARAVALVVCGTHIVVVAGGAGGGIFAPRAGPFEAEFAETRVANVAARVVGKSGARADTGDTFVGGGTIIAIVAGGAVRNRVRGVTRVGDGVSRRGEVAPVRRRAERGARARTALALIIHRTGISIVASRSVGCGRVDAVTGVGVAHAGQVALIRRRAVGAKDRRPSARLAKAHIVDGTQVAIIA